MTEASSVSLRFQWKGAYSLQGWKLSSLEMIWRKSNQQFKVFAKIDKNRDPTTPHVLEFEATKLSDKSKTTFSKIKFSSDVAKTIKIIVTFFQFCKTTIRGSSDTGTFASFLRPTTISLGKMLPLKEGTNQSFTVNFGDDNFAAKLAAQKSISFNSMIV